MTAQEAILWIDEKKHNIYTREDKLLWLEQVEQMVSQLASRFGEAGEETSEGDPVLRIPAPYDQLYLRWLEAQIDYTNQEYLKYNNAMSVFNTLWSDYANWYCRSHLAAERRFRL